jgi:hypothetical protein
MPAFAWVGAAAAALVASVLIMLHGGMIERPAKRPPLADEGGGSPSGAGIPTLGDDTDPFKRYPRPREQGGPAPTQTQTEQLYNDTWGDAGGDPAWSYTSAGDGSASVGDSGGSAPIPNTPGWFEGGYGESESTAGSYQPPPSGGQSSAPNTPSYFGAPSNAPAPAPVYAPSPGGSLFVKAM